MKPITIVRPLNVLLTFGSVLLGAYLASKHAEWNWLRALVAAGSASLILAAGNAFNDIIDIKSDRINHPDRPLVSGQVSRSGAWWLAVVCALVGLCLARLVSPLAFAVAVFVTLLLIAYSLFLQSVPLLGNLTVAVMAALTFPFGGIAVGSIRGTVYPALFALLFHLGREIVKDLEDRRGDTEVGINTLAVRFGVRFPRTVVSLVLAALIVMTFVPFFDGTYGLTYFLIALLGVDGLLAGMIWKLWTSDDPGSLRRVSLGLKAGMAVGLIAIVLG